MLKILAILVIVSPCLVVWKEGKEQFKAVQNGYRYEDFYKSYAVIGRTSGMSSIDRQKLFNDAYLTLSKYGAIYADYANYRLIPNEEGVYEEDTNNGAPKEIFINNNFMKKFPIKDVDGNLIQLEDTQNALLMPMAYKDSNYDYTSSFCQGQVVCDLIYIPDDTTLPVIDSLNYYAQYDIQGAIINVVNVPESTYSINVVYHSLFVNTKGEDPTQYVRSVLKNNKMSKQIDATAMTKLVHQSRDVLFSKIKKTGLQLAVYIILLLAYLYESVYLYLYQNQKELAVRYLHGNSYWKRYGVLYSSDLIFFVSACLCGIYFMAIPAAFMIAFCFIFYAFDSILTYAMIHYQQHKGILTTLKGEE